MEISSVKKTKYQHNHKYTQSFQCFDELVRSTICSKANTVNISTQSKDKYYYSIHNIILNIKEPYKNIKYQIFSIKGMKAVL